MASFIEDREQALEASRTLERGVMKAVVIDGYGSADRLTLREIITPTPGASQVLVRVRASSVNPVDWKLRQGRLTPVLDRIYPLEQIRQAHQASESGHARGKLVIRVE